MAARGPKMADGVWNWDSCQLFQNKFFDPSAPSMRKVADGKKRKRKEKKIMLFLVATNVVASRPPERRSTGTPHPCAKNVILKAVPGLNLGNTSHSYSILYCFFSYSVLLEAQEACQSFCYFVCSFDCPFAHSSVLYFIFSIIKGACKNCC